jgi:hypothetical protein
MGCAWLAYRDRGCWLLAGGGDFLYEMVALNKNKLVWSKEFGGLIVRFSEFERVFYLSWPELDPASFRPIPPSFGVDVLS